MNFAVITDLQEVAPIRDQWANLAQQDQRDGFFRTPLWCEAWMRHIRPDASPFLITARDGRGELVGVAPLCRLTYSDHGFRLTGLSFAGREVVSGDFLDFVAENTIKPAFVQGLLDHLWSVRSQWGLLVGGELLEDGSSADAIRTLCDAKGLALRVQEQRLCPYISLPATFDDYLGTLSSSTRYHIRRRTRDLLDKQKAEIHVYSEPSEIVPRLEMLMRLHVARWNRDNEPGTLGRPGFLDFLRDVCGSSVPYASSRLYVMTHVGEPVAALLMFYFGQSALYYQAGWAPDSAVSSFSPGVVLMARTVRDAIESGLKYYEFLRGDEAYKSRWTATHRTTATFLCARGVMARQYLRLCGWKDIAKHHLRNRKQAAHEDHPSGELVQSE